MSDSHAEDGDAVARKVFLVTMGGSVLFISAAFIVAFWMEV